MSQTSVTTFDTSRVLWEEKVPGGAHWSGIIRRGTTLRVVDLKGGANVSMLMFNHEDRFERYNMADTLKGQHTAFLTRGDVCYTDMGRVICSVTDDSCGWHDTLGGVSNSAMLRRKYGESGYQEMRNDYHRSGYDSLVNELGKYGLGKRDLVANLNLFSKVTVDSSGKMEYQPGNSVANDYIDLRFEMHALVVLATSPHPMDPETRWAPGGINLLSWASGTAAQDDPCRTRCDENQRAFINTERLYATGSPANV